MQKRRTCRLVELSAAAFWLVVVFADPSVAMQLGHLVEIEQLSFSPEDIVFPSETSAVLVVQNREEAPIQHEIVSADLFQLGTLISVQGTGKIEYNEERVSRVLLSPGEEVIIVFQVKRDRTYNFLCTLNGHAMLGRITTSQLRAAVSSLP